MIIIRKIFEIAYLLFGAFFLYEAYKIWNKNFDKAIIFIVFAVLAVFMYFFRRRFRKRLEK